MRKILITAVVSSLVTLALTQLIAAAPERETVLENERVRVIERIVPPGGERTPYTRETDQVIVFLNDTQYERTDPATGEKTVRSRKSGDVIWHDKGESAPKLVNVDSQPFRSLIIELK